MNKIDSEDEIFLNPSITANHQKISSGNQLIHIFMMTHSISHRMKWKKDHFSHKYFMSHFEITDHLSCYWKNQLASMTPKLFSW